jgi:hypothetical protein
MDYNLEDTSMVAGRQGRRHRDIYLEGKGWARLSSERADMADSSPRVRRKPTRALTIIVSGEHDTRM